jgi:O-antigen/teichoic acid export membrane protein
MSGIVRNVFANWIGVAANLAVAFLLSPYLVHSLGDNGYGLWVLVMSMTGYMGLLDTGLRVSIVKHTAKCNARGDEEGLNLILATGLLLYGSLSIVIVLLSLVASAYFPSLFTVLPAEVPIGRLLVIIAGINVALSLPLGVFGGLLSGLQRYDLVNRAAVLVLGVRTAAIVAAIASGYGLIALGLIHISMQVVNGVLLVVYARQQFPALDLRPRPIHRETVRSLYSYSGYIILNSVAMLLLFSSGEPIIGAFVGTAAVTSFAIARSLVQYLSTIIGSMTQVFHPYASDLHERGDGAGVGDALIAGTKTSLLIALPIAISYLIIGPTFIGLWMGPQYRQAAGMVLAILTVPQVIWLSQSTAGNILLGVGCHRFLTTLNLVTGAAGIAIALMLVRSFGAVGVAAGMAVPIFVTQALILPAYTAKRLNVSGRAYLVGGYLGPLAAALPYAATLWVVARQWPAQHLPALALQITCCLVVFAAFAYLLAFTRIERQQWFGRFSSSGRLAKAL